MHLATTVWERLAKSWEASQQQLLGDVPCTSCCAGVHVRYGMVWLSDCRMKQVPKVNAQACIALVHVFFVVAMLVCLFFELAWAFPVQSSSSSISLKPLTSGRGCDADISTCGLSLQD